MHHENVDYMSWKILPTMTQTYGFSGHIVEEKNKHHDIIGLVPINNHGQCLNCNRNLHTEKALSSNEYIIYVSRDFHAKGQNTLGFGVGLHKYENVFYDSLKDHSKMVYPSYRSNKPYCRDCCMKCSKHSVHAKGTHNKAFLEDMSIMCRYNCHMTDTIVYDIYTDVDHFSAVHNHSDIDFVLSESFAKYYPGLETEEWFISLHELQECNKLDFFKEKVNGFKKYIQTFYDYFMRLYQSYVCTKSSWHSTVRYPVCLHCTYFQRKPLSNYGTADTRRYTVVLKAIIELYGKEILEKEWGPHGYFGKQNMENALNDLEFVK